MESLWSSVRSIAGSVVKHILDAQICITGHKEFLWDFTDLRGNLETPITIEGTKKRQIFATILA